jgi:hypothetical protein
MVDFFLFRTALRDMARVRRLLAAAALIALPALLALAWRFSAPDAYDAYDAYNTLASVLVYGFLLVILAVVFGTGVVTQEIEQKTVVYLLTRPVPRWRILLAKFAAALVGIVVTTWLAAGLLAFAAFGMGGAQTSDILRLPDVRNPVGLIARLKNRQDLVGTYLRKRMRWWRGDRVAEFDLSKPVPGHLEHLIVRQINSTLRSDRQFYDPARFEGVELRPETKRLLAARPTGRDLVRLNRLLLEDAFPEVIQPRPTPVYSLPRDLAILPVGAIAYGALFLLLATLLPRPLMAGLIFAFGWEAWVPNMPGNFQFVSVMTYLRILSPHPQPPAETMELLQFLSGGNHEAISTAAAWGALLGIIGIMLAAALVVFSLREYVPRDDAE